MATPTCSKKFQAVDNILKLLVFGYCHCHEIKLKLSAIPMLIIYRIIYYLNAAVEYMQKPATGYKLSNYGSICTNVSNKVKTSKYHDIIFTSIQSFRLVLPSVENYIHKYAVKILNIGDKSGLFKFVLSSYQQRDEFYGLRQRMEYCHLRNGNLFGSDDFKLKKKGNEKRKYSTNDVLVYEVDFKSGSFYCCINNGNRFLIAKIIVGEGIEYQFGCAMGCIGDKIEFIKYECL